MIYEFRITETRVKYLQITGDSLEKAELEANRYVTSGDFDMDKNMDDYGLDVMLSNTYQTVQ